MFFKKITIFSVKWIAAVLFIGITGTVSVYAQDNMNKQSTPLTEPGNDIFGTIQEVVKKLEANPNTDWSKVNLEALRQHLLDMKAFTEDVAIISKEPTANGTKIEVHPTTARAAEALKRLFRIHPAMLKKEKGWNMVAKQNGSNWTITCTTNDKSDVDKIRALGYIGLLAEGSHHQLHHWMIATGRMKIK